MDETLSKYRKHAVDSLMSMKDEALMQRGKSAIEPISYIDNTLAWFCKLVEIVDKDIPQYYVRNLRVDQNENREILKYEYEYYNIGENINEMSLIITLI